jgi:hypothetical protein
MQGFCTENQPGGGLGGWGLGVGVEIDDCTIKNESNARS